MNPRVSKSMRRRWGHVGEFTPLSQEHRERFAKARRAQPMAFACEVLPDGPDARQAGLRARRVAKAAPAPLALPRRRMAVLRAVIEPGRGFDEHSLHIGRRRELGFGRRIAAPWDGHELVRPGLSAARA
ncbi:hypothetical protein MB84_28750 (plasmid) [Pandoraea oxalativorans]|uniref:Uncharacterized protein n=1 Tax=Pandoraea oxalativorans TaxID=573737 RepID=A0A0G3IFW3_9BURK|nr:hypothetical protein MB84_28750 [Pandoraea oxalativorans]